MPVVHPEEESEVKSNLLVDNLLRSPVPARLEGLNVTAHMKTQEITTKPNATPPALPTNMRVSVLSSNQSEQSYTATKVPSNAVHSTRRSSLDPTSLATLREETKEKLMLNKQHRTRVVGWIDHPYVQVVMMTFLMVALFASDVAAIQSASPETMDALDGVLLLIFVVFILEWIMNCVSREGYFMGFFFWMDMIGTLSIVADISWMAEGIGLDTTNNSAQKASRAARVGGKAGRLTRVLRVVRLVKLVFQFIINPQDYDAQNLASSGGAPSAIGQSLTEAITYQVTSIVLLTVLVIPLLVPDTEVGLAPQMFGKIFATQYNEVSDSSNELAVRNELQWLVDEFYSAFNTSKYYHPVYLAVGNNPRIELSTDEWYDLNNHPKDKFELTSSDEMGEDVVFMEFNIAQKNHEAAMYNILFIVYVLCALVSFSAILNYKTGTLVVKPLERIFSVIQEHASHVMGHLDLDLSVLEVENTVTKVKTLMKKVAGKTARGSVQTMIDEHGNEVDAETKAWLFGMYTDGTESAQETMKAQRKERKHRDKSPDKDRTTDQQVFSSGNSTNGRASKTMLGPLQQDDFRELLLLFPNDHESLTKVGPSTINTWDFDTFALSRAEMYLCVYYMFDQLGVLDMVPMDCFWIFLKEVDSLYHDNPYHNFNHCVDVAQTLFRILMHVDERMAFTSVEKFAMLVGAICHDLDHPGVSNAFLVSTRDDLAMEYNDSSVLENRHVSALYNLVQNNPKANIFKIVEEEGNWKDVRKIVISIILHTDMMHHFQMVSQLDVFTEVHDKSWTAGALIDFLKPDERVFILNLIMHSADISNPVKPFHVYEKWARAVLDEFFRQGDMERARGMPISPMMDRDATSMPLSQVNFIEFVVTPLYHHLTKLFPELDEMYENLYSNRRRYGELYVSEIEASQTKSEEKQEEEIQNMTNRFSKYIEKYNMYRFTEEMHRPSSERSLLFHTPASGRSGLSRTKSKGKMLAHSMSMIAGRMSVDHQSGSGTPPKNNVPAKRMSNLSISSR
mmetsp:Transcript_32529/g.62490  ORF Transcript_32529/g.62490 Transcript_32529/m.62490 type:complete len:1018 (+) Transcript_32529:392-3445(+)